MSDPILYLMSKNTGREADSLKENQDAWLALDQKGYLVYSPICEAHNIEEARKTSCKYMDNNCPYPILSCGTCKDVYKPIDYVARDLRLIESWLEYEDGQLCSGMIYHEFCVECQIFMNTIEESHKHGQHKKEIRERMKYQPKVVGVVLPSAFEYRNCCRGCGATYTYDEMKARHPTALACCPESDRRGPKKIHWDSKGAKAEYEFCQAKHILVISLDVALNEPFDKWREAGL